jgi:hypothetical protein
VTQFKVQFHRYGNGASRLSAPTFIHAESFHDATARATLMVSAMGEVDRVNEYIVAGIETVGLRGDECTIGWETEEEFSARANAKGLKP